MLRTVFQTWIYLTNILLFSKMLLLEDQIVHKLITIFTFKMLTWPLGSTMEKSPRSEVDSRSWSGRYGKWQLRPTLCRRMLWSDSSKTLMLILHRVISFSLANVILEEFSSVCLLTLNFQQELHCIFYTLIALEMHMSLTGAAGGAGERRRGRERRRNISHNKSVDKILSGASLWPTHYISEVHVMEIWILSCKSSNYIFIRRGTSESTIFESDVLPLK